MTHIKRIDEMINNGGYNLAAIRKWANESAQQLSADKDGCFYYYLGESEREGYDVGDGELYLVMGWASDFADDEPDNPYADGERRICIKLAFSNYGTCDYMDDWCMPSDEEEEDVDDTDSEYTNPEDAVWRAKYWKENYAIR